MLLIGHDHPVHLTGVLVRGACFGPAAPVLERFLSEPFLRMSEDFSIFREIRSETPGIAVFRGERLEERLVKTPGPLPPPTQQIRLLS